MPNSIVDQAFMLIAERFQEAAREIPAKFDRVVKVDVSQLIPLLTMLGQELNFNYLADMVAVDEGAVFAVYYRIHTLPGNDQIVVMAEVPREEALLPSITGIYPAADWQEREIYDLMGVSFDGHPNLTRILLPQDFQGHPLRKDYDQGRRVSGDS